MASRSPESCREIPDRPPKKPRKRARLEHPARLWARRSTLIGGGMLAVAAIGALAVFTDEQGDEPGSTPASSVTDETEVALTESLRERSTGLSGAYPANWRRSEGKGTIRLESPDDCVVIALSAPAKATDAKRLREDSIAALRRSFKEIQVRPEAPSELGGAPTTGAAIAVRTREGAAVAIRLSVSRGETLAHLTEVLFRNPPCEDALPPTQLILDSLEFSR